MVAPTPALRQVVAMSATLLHVVHVWSEALLTSRMTLPMLRTTSNTAWTQISAAVLMLSLTIVVPRAPRKVNSVHVSALAVPPVIRSPDNLTNSIQSKHLATHSSRPRNTHGQSHAES